MKSRTLSCILMLAAPVLLADAPITIVVVDPPGVGFNDPTPAEPVGGNTGTTIGEQRLIAFQYAASIWSSKLDSPVPIRIRASFKPLPCTADIGVGGYAGPLQVFSFLPVNPEVYPNVWYPAALANKLAGMVLGPNTEEITAEFNGNLGKPDCIASREWYYGLDTQAPPAGVNLVTLLLHEFAHGLGFLPTADLTSGSQLGGRGDVYSQHVLDTSTGKAWNEMTDREREASLTNTGRVVWNGINVRKDVPKVLQPGVPILRITAPDSIARDLSVVPELGPPLAWPGINGELVLALNAAEGAGPSRTDACSPLLNASEAAGRIVLADRGSCSFIRQALNAQAAGAVALVIANDVAGFPFSRGRTAPEVTIPTVHITLADGNDLKTALAAGRVSARLAADPNRLRGADTEGRPLLYAPDTNEFFTPIAHWDPNAAPSQLMAPLVMPDLGHSVEPPNDLTLSLLRDLGWFSDFDGVPDGVDQCPGSDRAPNLMIQHCDTGVSNKTFRTGCRISDFYKFCNSAGTSAEFTSCVELVSKELLRLGAIGSDDPNKVQACALRAVIP